MQSEVNLAAGHSNLHSVAGLEMRAHRPQQSRLGQPQPFHPLAAKSNIAVAAAGGDQDKLT